MIDINKNTEICQLTWWDKPARFTISWYLFVALDSICQTQPKWWHAVWIGWCGVPKKNLNFAETFLLHALFFSFFLLRCWIISDPYHSQNRFHLTWVLSSFTQMPAMICSPSWKQICERIFPCISVVLEGIRFTSRTKDTYTPFVVTGLTIRIKKYGKHLHNHHYAVMGKYLAKVLNCCTFWRTSWTSWNAFAGHASSSTSLSSSSFAARGDE